MILKSKSSRKVVLQYYSTPTISIVSTCPTAAVPMGEIDKAFPCREQVERSRILARLGFF